jgi:hypothetical protein
MAGNKNKLMCGLVNTEGRKLTRHCRTVHITKDEASLKKRRKLARMTTAIDQMERMYVVSREPLVLRTQKRALCDGQTNKGNWLGPVVLPTWSSSWQLTFGQKKELFGLQRRAVGGAMDIEEEAEDDLGSEVVAVSDDDTAAGAADEETPETKACIENFIVGPGRGRAPARPDGQREPVFFHTYPVTFFETVLSDYHISHVIDLTPGAGLMALAAIRKKLPYLGIAFTETHRKELDDHLTYLVQQEYITEGSNLYEPAFAELVAKGTSAAKAKGKAKTQGKAKAKDPKAKTKGKAKDPKAKKKPKGGEGEKGKGVVDPPPPKKRKGGESEEEESNVTDSEEEEDPETGGAAE